jgi:hypothetical protein
MKKMLEMCQIKLEEKSYTRGPMIFILHMINIIKHLVSGFLDMMR